jgi:hypothetical protein
MISLTRCLKPIYPPDYYTKEDLKNLYKEPLSFDVKTYIKGSSFNPLTFYDNILAGAVNGTLANQIFPGDLVPLHNALYSITLEDIPLYINEPELQIYVLFRLKIAK